MNQLQVLMWILTRSREPVQWAAHQPGVTQFLDLNPGPDNLDVEPPDDPDSLMLPEPGDPRYFESEEELIIAAVTECRQVCSLDDARKEFIVARDDGRLRAHFDPATGSEFFDHAAVLEVWKEPLGEPAADTLGAEEPGETPAQGEKPAGRPPEWDWQAIYVEARSWLNQRHPSMTPNLLSLVHTMQDWCKEQYGKQPSDTALKDKLRPLIKEMSGRGGKGEKDGN